MILISAALLVALLTAASRHVPACCTLFTLALQVATATAAVLVFISSNMATLTFIMEGRLITSYAAVFAAVAVLGSVCGLTVVGAVVRRTGRTSFIVLLLAGLMGLGGLLAATFGAVGVVDDVRHHAGLGFKSICASY